MPTMQRLPDAWVEQVNQEFETWECLRRQLFERENRWAAAVTESVDARRLARLQREVAQLRLALDEVFRRAIGTLEQSGVAGRTD